MLKRTPFESTGERGPRAAVTPEYAEAVARLVAEGYSEAAAVRALSCAPSDPSQLHRWRKSVPAFRVVLSLASLLRLYRTSAEALHAGQRAEAARLERAFTSPDPLERDRLQRALIAEGLESIERAERVLRGEEAPDGGVAESAPFDEEA